MSSARDHTVEQHNSVFIAHVITSLKKGGVPSDGRASQTR